MLNTDIGFIVTFVFEVSFRIVFGFGFGLFPLFFCISYHSIKLYIISNI